MKRRSSPACRRQTLVLGPPPRPTTWLSCWALTSPRRRRRQQVPHTHRAARECAAWLRCKTHARDVGRECGVWKCWEWTGVIVALH